MLFVNFITEPFTGALRIERTENGSDKTGRTELTSEENEQHLNCYIILLYLFFAGNVLRRGYCGYGAG